MFSGMVPNGSCLQHAALAVGNSTKSSYFCSSPFKKKCLEVFLPIIPSRNMLIIFPSKQRSADLSLALACVVGWMDWTGWMPWRT